MATNSSFVPTAMDLLMVGPRLAQKIVSFAFLHLPELGAGGSVIAEATAANVSNTTIITSVSSAFAQGTEAAVVAAAIAAVEADDGGLFTRLIAPFNLDGIRGFGGMFGYFSSRWALATFTVSIFLNRTQFYASSRQNLNIQWRTRLSLYSLPIILLLTQTLWVLQAMKCQTSPDYSLMRFGDPQKRLSINFGGDGGFIHYLSSTLLYWQDDATSCAAMSMSLVDNNKLDVMGSFSLIWPFFLTLCISQFVETLSCALQGRQPLPETGMTTFEHSLAFAECEAMISNALGMGLFGSSNKGKSTDAATSTAPDAVLLTRSMILQRLNVPSEVLLIAFISCLSHLSSCILAITGHRQKCRLVNTAIWALCYMSAFFWSFLKVASNPMGDGDDLGILRFPTVCIIGFIPHLLILVGISVCASIYGLALLVTAASLPPDAPPHPSIRERFAIAFRNLQANVQFSSSSSIKLDWQEDFYTALLKVGFNVLTAASEAVYLNEGNRIRISEMTWLEEKRLNDLTSRTAKLNAIPAELLGQRIAKGVDFTDDESPSSSSGYAKERKSKSAKDKDVSSGLDSGLGLAERRGRWQLMMDFFQAIFKLLARMFARIVIRALDRLGIERRAAWLVRLADLSGSAKSASEKMQEPRASADTAFWLLSEDGTLILPKDGNVDVENETRRRLQHSGASTSEEAVDTNLYSWWKKGGWWGDVDDSGDYSSNNTLNDEDDDTTSVMSMSTNASDASDASSSGRRTPTQEDPFPSRDSTTPDRTFGISDLARLLDPKSAADREEAQLLARHLQSDRPMTRSQYRRRHDRDAARILPGYGSHHASALPNGNALAIPTDLEEEQALELFLLERRAAKARPLHTSTTASAASSAAPTATGSWAAGAEGMGSGGPVCVVCQSAPRVILVWPCGCLSICDECRVGVAARNFANCLCCRTDVVAYSRLFVP